MMSSVIGNFKVAAYFGFAKALHFHIVAVIRADGNAGVDDLGNTAA